MGMIWMKLQIGNGIISGYSHFFCYSFVKMYCDVKSNRKVRLLKSFNDIGKFVEFNF